MTKYLSILECMEIEHNLFHFHPFYPIQLYYLSDIQTPKQLQSHNLIKLHILT